MSAPATDWNATDARPSFRRARRLRTALTRARGSSALRSARAQPVADDESERLRNVVAGLAERLGIAPPKLFVYDGPPNAFVTRSGAVSIERSLLEASSRTEVEAIAALCLVRLAPPARPGDPVGYDDDVRAAALTRFPPALSSALKRLEPESGRFAPLYVAATHPSHRPVAERVAALEDL